MQQELDLNRNFVTDMSDTKEFLLNSLDVTDFSPDFYMFAMDIPVEEPIMFDCHCDDSPAFWMDFPFSGRTVVEMDFDRSTYSMRKGEATCWYLSSYGANVSLPGPQQLRKISVRLGMEFIIRQLRDSGISFLKKLSDYLGEGGRGPFIDNCKISPEMSCILHQIYNCPYKSGLRKVYMQGKLLELFACRISHLCPDPVDKCEAYGLKKRDIDLIHHARDVLLKKMESPPSIMELAREVGINETKLKRGFRQLFGTTVFAHLRQQRMEKAREMLIGGDRNVCEVACSVGYSNASHFARAFQQAFGVNPGSYQKSIQVKIFSDKSN